MCKYFQDPNFWVSIISVCIAIFALFQSNKQIKISNKQSLFERRLEKYLIAKDLLNLFENKREHIVDDKDLHFSLSLQFSWLTNTTYLCDMIFAINEPLDSEKQNILLSKCEMLEKYATEINVLWDNEAGEAVGNFIRTYKVLLFKLYQQKVFVNNFYEYNKKQNGIIELMITGDEIQKKAKENANNNGLYKTIAELDNLYHKIIERDYEQTLYKSLKLKD